MTNNPDKLPAEAKANLERNGLFLDVTALAEENVFVRDMNEIEIATAFALYETGCTEAAAALLSVGQDAVIAASRRASTQRLIKILIRSDLETKGLKKAYDALTNVMDDDGESANARIRAAETVLKWSGELDKERDKSQEQELSNMPIGELEGLIDKLQARKDELSKNVIEQR